MRHGFPHHLRTLRSEQRFVDLRLMRGRAVERVVLMSEDEPLVESQGSQALVPSRRCEPGTHSVGMLDAVDMLHQSHPRGLEDIRGIALDELEIPGNRPDKPTVLFDKPLPRGRIAISRPADQPGRIEVGDVGALLLHERPSRHRHP
jgi:hypothetical protein